MDDYFWMKPVYRIPDNPCAYMEPGQKGVNMVPIERMNVRSFVTSIANGARVKGTRSHEVKGIAPDGGYGIATVLFTSEGGKTWAEARLGKDDGMYSFREWRTAFTPKPGKRYELACLAINDNGESRQFTSRWNPSGYMRNVVETVRVTAVRGGDQEQDTARHVILLRPARPGIPPGTAWRTGNGRGQDRAPRGECALRAGTGHGNRSTQLHDLPLGRLLHAAPADEKRMAGGGHEDEKVFGAPLPGADVETIVNHLMTQNGRQ